MQYSGCYVQRRQFWKTNIIYCYYQTLSGACLTTEYTREEKPYGELRHGHYWISCSLPLSNLEIPAIRTSFPKVSCSKSCWPVVWEDLTKVHHLTSLRGFHMNLPWPGIETFTKLELLSLYVVAAKFSEIVWPSCVYKQKYRICFLLSQEYIDKVLSTSWIVLLVKRAMADFPLHAGHY